MKNKKVSTGLGIGAIVFAIITILMGLAYFIQAKENSHYGYKLFDYMFKKGEFKNATLHYNTIYIIGFVLLILAIVALAGLVGMKLAKKENKQLTIGLVVVAFVGLLIPAIFAFFGKAVFVGELWKMGLGKTIVESLKSSTKLGAGAICAGVFGLLGAGSILGAYLTSENR